MVQKLSFQILICFFWLLLVLLILQDFLNLTITEKLVIVGVELLEEFIV